MQIVSIGGVSVAADRDYRTISKANNHADAIKQAMLKRHIYPRVRRYTV